MLCRAVMLLRPVTAAVLTALLLTPSLALPCSLVPQVSDGHNPPEVGRTALFLGLEERLALVGPMGARIELEEVAVTELESATTRGGKPYRFFRAAQPIPPGTYALDPVPPPTGSFGHEGGEVTITSSLAVARHSAGSAARLEVSVYDGAGCGEIDCGASVTTIVLEGASLPEEQGSNFLVTFELDDGESKRMLLAVDPRESFGSRILVYGGPDSDRELGSYGFCAKVAALHWDGTLGPELEAGCHVPEGGCRCTTRRAGSTAASMMLVLAAVVIARRSRGPVRSR